MTKEEKIFTLLEVKLEGMSYNEIARYAVRELTSQFESMDEVQFEEEWKDYLRFFKKEEYLKLYGDDEEE